MEERFRPAAQACKACSYRPEPAYVTGLTLGYEGTYFQHRDLLLIRLILPVSKINQESHSHRCILVKQTNIKVY